MPEPENPLDGVADDLFQWMNQEVDYHVEAMRGGYRSPFSADVSEKQKHDYYTRQMYQTQPDGTVQYDKPNSAGRDTLLKAIGTKAYAEVYQATKPKAGFLSEATASPADETAMPTMPEDTKPMEPGP